jgi:hypothetical protein
MDLIQSFTPESFAAHSALGAALVIPTVELLRAHLLKTLEGMWVVLLSVLVGATYGTLGIFAGYLDGTYLTGVTFGAYAGLLASGANKYVDGLAKK